MTSDTFEEESENLMRADTLLNRIEEQRYLLYITARNRRLADPEVVQMSQTLDRLLNQYHALTPRE